MQHLIIIFKIGRSCFWFFSFLSSSSTHSVSFTSPISSSHFFTCVCFGENLVLSQENCRCDNYVFLMWILPKEATSENYCILRQKSKVLDFLKSIGSESFANSIYKSKVGAYFLYSQLRCLRMA